MVMPWAGYLAVEAARRGRADGGCEVRRVRDAARSEADAGPELERARLAVCRRPIGIDEAMHPLALLATGLYGHELPPQDGAPVRIDHSVEVRLQEHQVDRQDHADRDAAADDVEKYAPKEYGFFGNVNPSHRSPALEPGDRATDRRVRPSPDAAVQRLRRPGREPLCRDGSPCQLLAPHRRSPSRPMPMFDGKFAKRFVHRAAGSCPRSCSRGTRTTATSASTTSTTRSARPACSASCS